MMRVFFAPFKGTNGKIYGLTPAQWRATRTVLDGNWSPQTQGADLIRQLAAHMRIYNDEEKFQDFLRAFVPEQQQKDFYRELPIVERDRHYYLEWMEDRPPVHFVRESYPRHANHNGSNGSHNDRSQRFVHPYMRR